MFFILGGLLVCGKNNKEGSGVVVEGRRREKEMRLRKGLD